MSRPTARILSFPSPAMEPPPSLAVQDPSPRRGRPLSPRPSPPHNKGGCCASSRASESVTGRCCLKCSGKTRKRKYGGSSRPRGAFRGSGRELPGVGGEEVNTGKLSRVLSCLFYLVSALRQHLTPFLLLDLFLFFGFLLSNQYNSFFRTYNSNYMRLAHDLLIRHIIFLG
ncbi:hypothetical protein BRADI_3g60444v3 [Brachypodium distachyon]|uniref:Uncharacterized protein n=1 Tax=Brachypodium distachyon TaxID=15368 RepID=A0A2K2D617_BRADI|nr:hypothetical protein BRADI_3g60444v3 [Brachypodium distachyon]